MRKEIQLIVPPDVAGEPDKLRRQVSAAAKVDPDEIRHVEILRRSVDARGRRVKVNLKVMVYVNEPYQPEKPQLPYYPNVSGGREVIIIGAGPAGLFAALRLIELGWKPVILERGKDVKARIRDIKALNVDHIVANLHYKTAGLLIRLDPDFAAVGGTSPLPVGDILTSLAGVTLGNIVGGSVLVAAVYWFIYLRPAKELGELAG